MTLTLPDMLCFSLYSANHAMQAAYKPLLDPLGLTYPQYLVLTALWQQDGQTVGTLGRALRLESNTLTPLLKRMEGQGLITRSRDKADERQVLIALTPEGRAMQSRAAHVPACLLDRAGLTVDQASALRDTIAALRERLVPARP
ncbi:MAG: MarR family transcriptional regulator [Rhodobacterales bacterium]|nr:MarR family transcriptional regulator [Rhodobacterales bacterium]MDX5390889.1 MarR family transcriptional regulator [Rhodobacterales bacterium]MDX5490584.1 MarR family transcriptional regulator [Rhodobacterales bacterium]